MIKVSPSIVLHDLTPFLDPPMPSFRKWSETPPFILTPPIINDFRVITRKRLDGFVWLAHKSKFDDESIGAGPEIRELAVQQNISGTQKVGVARKFFVLISPFFLILDPNMVWHLSPFINPFMLPKISV